MHYMSKFLFIMGAVGMIGISSIRFTSVAVPSVHDVILDCYYLFLGFIIALSQLDI